MASRSVLSAGQPCPSRIPRIRPWGRRCPWSSFAPTRLLHPLGGGRLPLCARAGVGAITGLGPWLISDRETLRSRASALVSTGGATAKNATPLASATGARSTAVASPLQTLSVVLIPPQTSSVVPTRRQTSSGVPTLLASVVPTVLPCVSSASRGPARTPEPGRLEPVRRGRAARLPGGAPAPRGPARRRHPRTRQ